MTSDDDTMVQQTDRLRTLSEISRVLSSTLDLGNVYEEIYQQVGRVTGTTVFFIALNRPDGTIYLPYFREMGELYLDFEVPAGPSVTRLAMERGMSQRFGTDAEYQTYCRNNGLPAIEIGDCETVQGQSEAMLYVPLNTGSRSIGVLSVQSVRQHAYTEEDLQTLSIIAAQAAVAIENARLYTEQRNRAFELQTIQSIVQKLAPLHDISAIADLIHTELRQLIDYHACRLFVLDPGGKTLASVGHKTSERPLQLKMGQGMTGWIAQTGTSVTIPNTLEDSRVHQIEGTPRREESMIGTPLVYQGKVRGVIMLTKLGVNRFGENELRLLEIVAGQTAIAFDRARLYEELRTEAITDPLTQVHNRRYLAERFREEQARAMRSRYTLAAMMLDLDAFKRVNDTFGHDAGDVVLQDLAVVLRAVVRTGDIVARYGGEEFCILLPETSLEQSSAVAERLRSLIERRQLPPAAGVRHVTVSVGLALLEPDTDESNLFTRADLAMYEVKRRGGNAVCVARAGRFDFPAEIAEA